jgi:hypothetical protein
MGNVPFTFDNESMQSPTSSMGFITEMRLILSRNVEGGFRDEEFLVHGFVYCQPVLYSWGGNKFRRYSPKVQLRRFQMDSLWTSFGGSHFRHNLAGTRTPHSVFRRHGVPAQLQHCCQPIARGSFTSATLLCTEQWSIGTGVVAHSDFQGYSLFAAEAQFNRGG